MEKVKGIQKGMRRTGEKLKAFGYRVNWTFWKAEGAIKYSMTLHISLLTSSS